MKNSLKRNIIFDSLHKILNILFPLVTSMYLARILTTDGIGRITYAQNIASYFVVFASLGIPNYGIREIAKVRNNSKDKNIIFSELFMINLISTILCAIIYYIFIFLSNQCKDKLLFAVCGLLIILNVFNVDWLYKGVEDFKFIAMRSFFIKIVSVILICLLVRQPEDYLTYAMIHCGALGGNYIFNIINSKKYVKISFHNLSLPRHIKSIFIMLATVISVEIYAQMDITMLGMRDTSDSVAYYSYSIKAIRMISTLFSSIAAVLLPRLSLYYAEQSMEKFSNIVNRVYNVIVFLCLPAFVGIWMLSDNLVLLLYGRKFIPASLTMKILSPLILIYAIGNLFGTQILITVGQESKLLITTIIGAICNLILNSILIPTMSQNGAALASVICEIIVLIIQYIFAKRYVEILHSLKIIFSTTISIVVMAALVWLIKKNISNNFISVFSSVILGGLLYFIMQAVFKNPVINEILRNASNRGYKN